MMANMLFKDRSVKRKEKTDIFKSG
jgi:hypothetical protein